MSDVKFVCNSGANIYSARKDVFNTVKDFGMEEGEWEALSEDERFELVNEWAQDRLEIYWEYVDKKDS